MKLSKIIVILAVTLTVIISVSVKLGHSRQHWQCHTSNDQLMSLQIERFAWWVWWAPESQIYLTLPLSHNNRVVMFRSSPSDKFWYSELADSLLVVDLRFTPYQRFQFNTVTGVMLYETHQGSQDTVNRIVATCKISLTKP